MHPLKKKKIHTRDQKSCSRSQITSSIKTENEQKNAHGGEGVRREERLMNQTLQLSFN